MVRIVTRDIRYSNAPVRLGRIPPRSRSSANDPSDRTADASMYPGHLLGRQIVEEIELEQERALWVVQRGVSRFCLSKPIQRVVVSRLLEIERAQVEHGSGMLAIERQDALKLGLSRLESV